MTEHTPTLGEPLHGKNGSGALAKDEYLLDQARRVHEMLRVAVGVSNLPTLDRLVTDLVIALTALDESDSPIACFGQGFIVRWGEGWYATVIATQVSRSTLLSNVTRRVRYGDEE